MVVSETMKMIMDDDAIEAIVSMLMELQEQDNTNIHPAPGLGDAKTFAVEHLPLHTIPQSVQRIEDGCKRPPAVMR